MSTITSASGKKYKPTIGLEIHAELKTASKMFCACKNDPDESAPNINVCPICMGHPGTLPVINKKAVEHVIRIGHAVGAKIADFTEWDRKNYFYPDIPKGYQISQYAHPLITGGSIGGVELTRIHLEEDTAKSSHDKGDFSLVDFNRSSLPLMELVTEPVIHDATTASKFAKELQLLLRYLGAGEANMEKGEMRVEANISVSTSEKFGTKVEVKNLNSFKSVERSIAYEIDRHIDLLERGEKIIQETRGFDESTGKTFSQRVKEDSHDYRYFPEPDLPKLFISEIPEFQKEAVVNTLPELPWKKRDRYKTVFGMKDEDAEMFVQNENFRDFFESVCTKLGLKSVVDKEHAELARLAINYITSDIAGLIKKFGDKTLEKNTNKDLQKNLDADSENKLILISVDNFSELIQMIKAGELSSRGAKDILTMIWEGKAEVDMSPRKIAEKNGMIQKNDPEALQKMIQELIERNPTVVSDYKSGKQAALQFFVGQIMKMTKGAVNPQIAQEAIKKILE